MCWKPVRVPPHERIVFSVYHSTDTIGSLAGWLRFDSGMFSIPIPISHLQFITSWTWFPRRRLPSLPLCFEDCSISAYCLIEAPLPHKNPSPTGKLVEQAYVV